jgi:hypothetical protein
VQNSVADGTPLSQERTLPRDVSQFLAISLAEVGDFGVADCGDVAAGDEELHDLGAFTGEGGPSRGSCGVLLEAADALAGEFEIDLG